MPLGRTTSGTTNLLQTTLRISPKRRLRQATTPDQDVIELSSDNDDDVPSPPLKRQRSKRKATAVTQAANYDVLEISDSEDPPLKHATNKPTDEPAVRRNKRLQEENDRLKKHLYTQRKDLDATQRELHKAKREISENKKKLSKASNMNLDSLEEELQCEVCTMKMWSPYLLSECGHVFCQDCLTNWFGTTQVQHMNSHPAYVPLPPHLIGAMRNPDGDPQMYLQARMFLVQHPPPKYTCPTCRLPVTRKPVEDYTLKKVIAWVTNAQNEQAPPGKGAGRPWDGFFPV